MKIHEREHRNKLPVELLNYRTDFVKFLNEGGTCKRSDNRDEQKQYSLDGKMKLNYPTEFAVQNAKKEGEIRQDRYFVRKYKLGETVKLLKSSIYKTEKN
jgi:hypothetical protein